MMPTASDWSEVLPDLASWLDEGLAQRSSDTRGSQVLASNMHQDTMVHFVTQNITKNMT